MATDGEQATWLKPELNEDDNTSYLSGKSESPIIYKLNNLEEKLKFLHRMLTRIVHQNFNI